MYYKIIDGITSDEFLIEAIRMGKPIEVSLVGVFDKEGRGSRRDIDLPLHRDGDYSTEVAKKHSIDWVCLYCIREGESITIIETPKEMKTIQLKKGQAIFINNKLCRHARQGKVGDRLLLRVWIEE